MNDRYELQQLLDDVDRRKEAMLSDHMLLSAIPAINPRAGGGGEAARIAWLEQRFDALEIPYEVFSVPDCAVAEGQRRSLIVRYPETGESAPRLWFIAHVDTVNCGDRSQWESDPFVPCREGDVIRCLGAEDNTQAVICGLHLLELLHERRIVFPVGLGFLFVADEETGSVFGLKAMVAEGIFHQGDAALIPDSGNAEGSFVEIAEKGVLWLEFTVTGRQAHASRPHTGINAASAAARLVVGLEDALRNGYPAADRIFAPPVSTFECTQVFAAGQSVNMIPGQIRFCLDCRLLPCYDLEQVIATIDQVIKRQQDTSGAEIVCRILQRIPAAPATSGDTAIVRALLTALTQQGITARVGGIGGSTCAAILRREGIDSAVWSTINGMAHKPNEYTSWHNIRQDMQVFLRALFLYAEIGGGLSSSSDDDG